MRLPTPLRRRARRAFTIIELLVAISVTAIMVTLMVNISINLLKAWSFTSGQLTAGNQARIALDYLSQDLQSAVIKRDGNVWLAATVQRNPPAAAGDASIGGLFEADWDNASPNRKPDGGGAVDDDNSLDLAGTLPADVADQGKIESVRFGRGGVWLRLFTTPPDTNTTPATTSAPRAVSYQLSRGRIGPNTDEYFYALFRSEVPPDATFAAGYDITSASTYDVAGGAPANVIRQPGINDIIANNVVDFGVRLYERNAAGTLFEVFPVRRDPAVAPPHPVATAAPLTYLGTTLTTPYGRFGNNAGTNLTPGIPVVAEVMVRILTPEGQRLLAAFEGDTNNLTNIPDGLSADAYWWQIVEAHSRVYSRRVEIRGSAL
jgi:hypothetical protein